MVSEGYHQVFIKVGRFKFDAVEVDLAGGEAVHLACGLKPLIRSRFLRIGGRRCVPQ
jgi:hypothetical protein